MSDIKKMQKEGMDIIQIFINWCQELSQCKSATGERIDDRWVNHPRTPLNPNGFRCKLGLSYFLQTLRLQWQTIDHGVNKGETKIYGPMTTYTEDKRDQEFSNYVPYTRRAEEACRTFSSLLTARGKDAFVWIGILKREAKLSVYEMEILNTIETLLNNYIKLFDIVIGSDDDKYTRYITDTNVPFNPYFV
jgi:hypothetical protein